MRRAFSLSPAPLVLALVAAMTGVGGVAGCGESRQPPPGPAAPGAPGAAAARAEATNAVSGDGGAATGANALNDKGETAPPYDGPYFGATAMQALVLSDMEWPSRDNKEKVQRLGYIRIGEKAPVIPEAHKKPNCSEGWYELVAGGFVCGKYGTLDLNHPKFRLAHPPDLVGALPYTYGQNSANGTPLYRVTPSREERKRYEPWLTRHRAPPAATASSDSPASQAAAIALGPTDAGLPPLPSIDIAVAAPAGTSATTAPAEDDGTPWYLKDYDGGAQPNITLDELKEGDGGPVVLRMVKGFYVSLDKQFVSNSQTFWRLNNGLIAPADRIWLAHPQVEWHGIWLDGSAKNDAVASGDAGAPAARVIDRLPVGFITSKTAHKWLMADSHKSASMGGALKHWAIVQLTDQTATVNGTEFFETTEGWWLRGLDGTKTEPGPAPEGLAEGEKWIDVNLKRQTLVAFAGDKAVFATIVSSGRPQHDTPPGSFRIREKHISATMDGDADIATDGPYSIQDVPYIQYFNAGYALHGAFWHANFGHVQSHGCVNLSPLDAKALFGFTEPKLPDGWHSVNATKESPGTRVVVHF